MKDHDNSVPLLHTDHIAIDAEKLKNIIKAKGLSVAAFARSLGYNRQDWAGYLYMKVAMPPTLFWKIVDALNVEPEDIAAEKHTLYGKTWDGKREMIRSLQRILYRMLDNPLLEKDFTDALAKFAPYLLPKAIQDQKDYTPEEWARSFTKSLLDVREGKRPEDLSESDAQILEDFAGGSK